MRNVFASAFAAVAYFAVFAAAHAQAPALQPQANMHLLGRLTGGATLERYLETLRNEFTRLDADGNGTFDQADIDLQVAITSAGMRSVLAMQVMGADLDGDGAVTERELRQRLEVQWRSNGSRSQPPRPGMPGQQERIDQEVAKWMAADTNKDGRITWDELIEFAKKQPGGRASAGYTAVSGKQLLELAPAGKTSITLAEIEVTATAFFKSVDTDNNGTISLDELDKVRKDSYRAREEAARLNRTAASRVPCELPKPSDAAQVVLLGAYETEALSNVALGSQDEVTGVGNVKVEPGDGPLYVVLATYRPTIWRFSGAVERIERAVIVSTPIYNKDRKTAMRPGGATGLPADRVAFPERAMCLSYFTDAPSIGSAEAVGRIKQALAKIPVKVAAKYKFAGVSVPSGKLDLNERNPLRSGTLISRFGNVNGGGAGQALPPGDTLERRLLEFNPGGVADVDPAKVVSGVPVARYEVLPQEAGLVQLLNAGAIKRDSNGKLLITKKIRIPAGLAGAHSVLFLLERGVPEPDGDAGHSAVISEATGLRLELHKN
jgi:Ca2+-binding EF-hand superfamily protein